MGRTLEGKLFFRLNLIITGVHLWILPKAFEQNDTSWLCRACCAHTLCLPVSGNDVPWCSLLPRDLGSGRRYRISYRSVGGVTNWRPTFPCKLELRLESDMRIAVITGIHSGSLCLSEISLILTFGGSLISFPSVWKSISSNRRFCLQDRRWIPIAARSSVWSEGSQCMTWKQKA